MTSAEQIGSQLKAARESAGLSLRALEQQVDISASTIGEYERGIRVPEADKLARMANALSYFTFRVDQYTFTVGLPEDTNGKRAGVNEQLPLDFSDEYNYAKASIKIKPGRITVVFDGVKAQGQKSRLTVSSN